MNATRSRMIWAMKHTDRDSIPMSARNLRLDAGLKGTEVAAHMGVSQGFVSQFERARSNPSANTVVRFLRAVDQPDMAARAETAATALARRNGQVPRTPALYDYFVTVGQNDLALFVRAVSKQHLPPVPGEVEVLPDPAPGPDPAALADADAAMFVNEACRVVPATAGQTLLNQESTTPRELYRAYVAWSARGVRPVRERLFLAAVRGLPQVVAVKRTNRAAAFNLAVRSVAGQ